MAGTPAIRASALRRRVSIALAGALLLGPRGLAAQARKPFRVGFFYFGSQQSAMETGRHAAFLQGMLEQGYEISRHFVLVDRYVGGKFDEVVRVAAQLMKEELDVIVSTATVTHDALKTVTKTTPIVTTIAVDPVRSGYAETLARPGRNFTGVTAVLSDVFPKHIDLLKSLLPKLSRVAVLWASRNSAHAGLLNAVQTVARANSLQIVPVRVNSGDDIDAAFASMKRERAEALIILGDSFFVQSFGRLAEQAVAQRVATIYSTREFPELGGLMSYGPNFRDNYRRAAGFVVKILKGAAAAELPFEQPTKFELVVNRKTAGALGLTIPDDILLGADTVID